MATVVATALQRSAVGKFNWEALHASSASISSCSPRSLLRKPDDELGIGLRRVKGHDFHVALDSTVWNARFCNDGVRSHAILFWWSSIVLLFQSKNFGEHVKLKQEPRGHDSLAFFHNDMHK